MKYLILFSFLTVFAWAGEDSANPDDCVATLAEGDRSPEAVPLAEEESEETEAVTPDGGDAK